MWRMKCNGDNRDIEASWEIVLVMQERSLLATRTETVAEEIRKFLQCHEV